MVLYQADEWWCDKRPRRLSNNPGLEGKKRREPIETETHEVSKRGATTCDSAFKLFKPNVWMLDLRFNVRTFTVTASPRPDPAAMSRRSAHICGLPHRVQMVSSFVLAGSTAAHWAATHHCREQLNWSQSLRQLVPWIYDTFTAARCRLDRP
jgi:hypothetical protein